MSFHQATTRFHCTARSWLRWLTKRLPQQKLTVETPWYKEAQTFEGPLFRDVMKEVGIKGKKLYVVALNDYAAEIPLADLEKLAETWGVPVCPTNKRPHLFDSRHPNFACHVGIRTPAKLLAELKKTDLLIALGVPGLVLSFAAAATMEERKAIAEKIQLRAVEFVPYVPVMQTATWMAHRKSVTNLVSAPLVPYWGLEKAN